MGKEERAIEREGERRECGVSECAAGDTMMIHNKQATTYTLSSGPDEVAAP